MITVGPAIVSNLEASVGSPTEAWMVPAAIDRAPASTATHPSHLG